MLDKQRIRSRIEEMRKRVKLLEKDFKPLSEEKLILDENLYAAAERHLEIAIQCCIDIGGHIIAQMGLERPKKENREIFTILAKEKILPFDLSNQFRNVANFPK